MKNEILSLYEIEAPKEANKGLDSDDIFTRDIRYDINNRHFSRELALFKYKRNK